MGMSIEEQIKGLEYLKKCGIFPFSDTRTGIVFTDECISDAIDTMHKYQKIVSIVSLNDEEFKQCGLKELKGILEVIADGAINSSDCI